MERMRVFSRGALVCLVLSYCSWILAGECLFYFFCLWCWPFCWLMLTHCSWIFVGERPCPQILKKVSSLTCLVYKDTVCWLFRGFVFDRRKRPPFMAPLAGFWLVSFPPLKKTATNLPPLSLSLSLSLSLFEWCVCVCVSVCVRACVCACVCVDNIPMNTHTHIQHTQHAQLTQHTQEHEIRVHVPKCVVLFLFWIMVHKHTHTNNTHTHTQHAQHTQEHEIRVHVPVRGASTLCNSGPCPVSLCGTWPGKNKLKILRIWKCPMSWYICSVKSLYWLFRIFFSAPRTPAAVSWLGGGRGRGTQRCFDGPASSARAGFVCWPENL